MFCFFLSIFISLRQLSLKTSGILEWGKKEVPLKGLFLIAESLPIYYQRNKLRDWDLFANWKFHQSLIFYPGSNDWKRRWFGLAITEFTLWLSRVLVAVRLFLGLFWEKIKSIISRYFQKLGFMSSPWNAEVSFERYWFVFFGNLGSSSPELSTESSVCMFFLHAHARSKMPKMLSVSTYRFSNSIFSATTSLSSSSIYG